MALAWAQFGSSSTRPLRERHIGHLPTGPLHDILGNRAGEQPPDREEIVREAEVFLEGQFEVLSQRLVGFERHGQWSADPITGRATPDLAWYRTQELVDSVESDIKLLWELNRHHSVLRLGQAYFLTEDPRFAEEMRALIESWIRQDRPGFGINWCSTLEVAFRSTAWCWAWHLTHRSPIWSKAFSEAFFRRLEAHGKHIYRYDSTHHSPNTHLTGEAISLLYLAVHFPSLRSAKAWRRRALRILLEQSRVQILEDGMHFERSTGYHRYTLEFYTHLRVLANWVDVSVVPEVDTILRKLITAAECLERPDGSWPTLGDEDGGRFLRLSSAPASNMRPVVATATDLLHPSDQERWDSWWLRAESTIPTQLDPWSQHETQLPDAGYFASPDRDANPWWVLVDAGPLGPLSAGHGHADLAHLELTYRGIPVVSDSGCGVYGADPVLRNYFRSEDAHARPVLEGFRIAKPAGIFSWQSTYQRPKITIENGPTLWQMALGYRISAEGRTVDHVRRVMRIGRHWVLVIDRFYGRGRLKGSLRWPLAAREAVLEGDGVRCSDVSMRTQGIGESLSVSPPRLDTAARAPSYGQITNGLCVDTTFVGPLSFALATVFGRGELTFEGYYSSENRSIVIELRDGTHSSQILVPEKGAAVISGRSNPR